MTPHCGHTFCGIVLAICPKNVSQYKRANLSVTKTMGFETLSVDTKNLKLIYCVSRFCDPFVYLERYSLLIHQNPFDAYFHFVFQFD